MIFWFFIAALVGGLMYWRQGPGTVIKVVILGFIAGVAGGAIGGWL